MSMRSSFISSWILVTTLLLVIISCCDNWAVFHCHALQVVQLPTLGSRRTSLRKKESHRTGRSSNFQSASTQLHIHRRRDFFHQTATAATSAALVSSFLFPSAAVAGGLLQFPISPDCPLKNKYHFMRAGPSELEMEGIYSTNPLFLTNRENAMDPAEGEKVLRNSLDIIRQQPPTVAYHSLAANGMDTGDLIARELKLGREKLLPEFTYLDQRGAGLWDASEAEVVKPAIFALDYEEAGERGMNGRPPAKDDGTPNETLNDQFIRLRQFLSLQESRTSGDVILVIFPDGTGPALLSCMIAGIPYKDVHALEFEPGEVRLDITRESVQKLFAERKDHPVYLETLRKGKQQLAYLREQGEMVGLKELREEKAQAAIEAEYQAKKQADAAKETLKRQEQAERQRQIQLEYQERNKQKKEDRAKAVTPAWKTSTPSQDDNDSDPLSFLPVATVAGILGIGAIGATALGDNDSTTKTSELSNPTPTPTDSEMDAIESSTVMKNVSAGEVGESLNTVMGSEAANATEQQSTSVKKNTDNNDSVSVPRAEDVLDELAIAEQAMKEALVEAGQMGGLFDDPVPKIGTNYDKDEMFDDGGADWLRVLSEIREEDDVEEGVVESFIVPGSNDTSMT